MFRRILVPLDGSRFAEAALPLAAHVAKSAGASLELASAFDALPTMYATGADMGGPLQVDPMGAIPVTAGDLGESLREERTTYLRGAARRVRESLGVEPAVALLTGRADRAVMDRVAETGTDLVVMATHGRGAMERAWLGSVADSLVRRLTVPVVLVRPEEGEAPEPLAAPRTRRVLLALDGSELAETALDPATHLARALHVPVALVRAVGGGVEIQSTYLPHAAQAHHEHLEAERRDAVAYLDDVAGRLAAADMEVTERLVREGPAARVVLDAADVEGRDLIAMATHGRGGLRRLVLGSVSDKVVRAATGPILLVRPPGDD
jgi:nucleotide-binding universal stress UspA family protein